MTDFMDKDTAVELFTELWARMIDEYGFGEKLKEEGITIKYVTKNPEVVMYIDENGPLFNEEAEKKKAVVTMRMDGETVHKFWLKKLDVAQAMATRKIKSKGPVAKSLKLLPMLKPGHEIYPEYCRKYNLPLD